MPSDPFSWAAVIAAANALLNTWLVFKLAVLRLHQRQELAATLKHRKRMETGSDG